MVKAYRTLEQLNEILESMVNGNWSQAAQECVDYGFYANDLVRMVEDNDCYEVPMADLVELIEMATELRCQNE